jgi:hypothetical protein
MMAVVLAFVLALGLPLAAGGTWAEYRPQGVGYAIDLPGEWILIGEDVAAGGAVQPRMASVPLGRRIFVAMHGPFPEDIVGRWAADITLDALRDWLVGELGGALRSEHRMTIDGLPARHLVVDLPDDAVAVTRFLLIESTLVQAVVMGPPGVEAEADTKRCLESLKLVSRRT